MAHAPIMPPSCTPLRPWACCASSCRRRVTKRSTRQLQVVKPTLSPPLPPASRPPPPALPSPPQPPQSPRCSTAMDFAMVLDESGSMKNFMEGPNGLKAFAKELVSEFDIGENASRFSVVSFEVDATTRVLWSHDAAVIGAGIDEMTPGGRREPTPCCAVGCTHRLLAACCVIPDTTRVCDLHHLLTSSVLPHSLPCSHRPARRSRTAS